MRRFTRLALAALAAIGASGALVAAPAASWVNFGDGINNGDGTTKYYGGNAAYYITVTGGTRAADGSYIQVGTPAVEATEETEAVAATPGSVQLTVPSAVLTGKALTIVAEVQYLSAEANTLIELVVGSNAVRLNSTGTQLQQCWNDTANYGSCDWTPTDRQRVTFTYQGADNQGSHTYLGDTPTAAAMSATNLMTSTSNIGTITLGKAATGLKIYSLYVYTTKLASASAVTTEIASNKAALAVPLSFTFSRAGLSSAGNTMEVLQVGGGAAKASTFMATLGTNATRATDGGGESNEGENPTPFFKSVTTGSSLLTTNGYAMVQSKFNTTGGSTPGEGWSIYLPFTPSVAATVTRVCPQLFAVNASGDVQSDSSKVFGYTVTLYEGTVNATTESPTALATVTGTTGSLNQTLVNTQAADFDSALTLNAGALYTMKLAVSDNSTGGGSYSGIGGVVFSSVIGRTVSGEGTWSANWPAGSAPAEGSAVELTVSDAATLSMDAAASLSSLTVLDGSADSSASLTFNGEQSLTSSATILNVDTDVSAITASLGAVTLASGKTLTTKSASDFSSITAGSGATVKYTAPSGSIAKVDNATVELAAGENSISGITLPSAGGTYKVSSGTYTGMTLTLSATATNYTFAGGNLTFGEQFSFGTATATISGGTITAPKMVTVQGGNGRTSTVTQTDGEITITGTNDGSSTSAPLMFGHWRNSTSTYNLSGGFIKVEKGGMRLGHDSSATLNISGTGLLKAKGLWGQGAQTCALNLSGGKLSLGSEGFKSIANLTVTATGGELNAFASNTIAQAITVNDLTTFSADTGCEMTISGALSGSGTVKKSGAGTLSLTGTVSTPVELAQGTLDLGTQRPAVTVTGEGTTLKLTLTPDEALTGCAALAPTLGDGVTSYTLEVSFCGTPKSATKSTSGVVTFPAYEATTTGRSWWWDYEFNGNVNNTGSDNTALAKDGADPVYDNDTALKLKSTPYRDATYPAEFTAVMYAKAGTTPYGGLLAFGTKSGGAISLVCGADPENGQVRLIYSMNETVTELISAEAMSVPNATTANHLYAFTKRIEDGNTVIDVYLDGRKLAHYAFSGAATIGGGFQVGSLHGGTITGAIVKASDENGTVDFLRVSNTVLSDAAIAALAAAYPYTSPNGKATRTVTAADTAWSADGAWTEGETTVAAPTAGKVVELTANENASLAVALEADVSYESLKLSGTGTVALTRGEGTTGRVVVQGVTTVETNSTVDARAVKLTGLTIAEGKTLTIDCSGLVLLQDTYRLTGYIDETTFSRISVTLPSAEADTPFTFEATRDSTGSVVLRVTAVKDLSATVSADTAWASVLWTWEGHETPTALQTHALGNATLTFANNAAISTPAALTVTGTLTASGTGSIDLPRGSTVNTTLLSDSATVILHQSQAEVVSTRSGSDGTFKFVGGTTAAPLVVPYNVAFPGAIAVAADSCVKLECTTGANNVSYQVSGAGQSSTVILTSDHDWGVINTGSVTSIFRNLTLSLGGTKNFWFRAGLTDNVWLDIQSGRTLKQEDDAPNTNVGGVLTVRNLTGGGNFESLNRNQTLRLLNTDPAASTFNAVPTIRDGNTNFKLVFAGNWQVGAALTDVKTPPIIHIGDGTTETTVETAVAFAPGAAYTVQANATLRPTAAAAALPASLTLAEGGKVQLTLDTLTLPSALSGTGSVLFGNGTDTFAYTLAAAPANFTGTYNVAANSTLTLTSAPNGSAGFAGSGTLVIGNGTAATNVTSTKAYPDASQPLTVQVKSPSTLTLNPGAGNFAFPNAVAFDVASGAKLVLASGMSFFGVSGEGSCSVTGDYVFGVSGSDFSAAAKVLNVATLTVGTPANDAVTLSVRPFGAIAIAPTTLKVNKNAVIARDSNTSATAAASVSLGATATVTGEGTIELPVAFTNGATLDTVTAAPLLLKGKVTGLIKVKLDTAKAVLTTTPDAEFDRNTQLAFASDATSQEFAGYRFAETVFGTTHTFTVVPPLTLPELPEAVSGNVAAQDAIYDAVAAMKGYGYDITSVTAVTAQSTGGVAGNVEALALFENLYALATPVGDPLEGGTYAGTVTVYYDFGISEMRVKSASLVNAEKARLYVLLCAKVATTQGTSTANYASGTIVSLYRGTEALSAVEPTDAQLTALGITPAAGEKWFAVPMAELNSGTNAFKVKASQTTPAAN